MRKPTTVRTLEKLGRVQLSPSFFMRDFLYSEISQIEGIPNIPDNPELAIEVGKHLCGEILEPIQSAFGRISIRSAFRSSAVNEMGAANGNQYGCASNKANYAGHIWDHLDANKEMGATACIVVNNFLPYYEKTKNWTPLAWWIHDHIPAYSEMQFFRNLAAFNISWHQSPAKKISSFVEPLGVLTRPGMENFGGSHSANYQDFLDSLK